MSPFRASAGFTDKWEHFDFAISDGVATVTLSRPDKLNALTFEAYADLRDLLAELPQREDVRVLVLTGKGRGFCSGGDVEEIIGELQRMEAKQLLEFTRMTGSVVDGAEISNSIVGSNAKITKSVLRNSLVGDDTVVTGVKGEVTVGDHSEVRAS